jgi:hypothetical protein
MGWDSASRSNINRLQKLGVVAVRYQQEGCNVELEVLSNCTGEGSYTYSGYAAREQKVMRNSRELYAQLPIGAAGLQAKVAGEKALRTDYMLAGSLTLDNRSYERTDLKGGCDRATHVVSAIFVGGFAMASGDEQTIAGGLSVFGVGVGSESTESKHVMVTEGRAEACEAAMQSGKPENQCLTPLRLVLLPLEGEDKGNNQPAAPVGCHRDGCSGSDFCGVDGKCCEPKSFREVGRLDTKRPLWNVTVHNDVAYLSGMDGLILADVSDPTSPQELSRMGFEGRYARDTVVVGDRAYVATRDRLSIVDVSNPKSPVEIGHSPVPKDAFRLAVSGKYAYVSDPGSPMHVIDVSDASSPKEIGSFAPPGGRSRGITAIGHAVLMTVEYEGLSILDVDDPTNPRQLSFRKLPNVSGDVASLDNYAFVANDGLRVFDISPLHSPTEVAYRPITGGGWEHDMHFDGKYVYIVHWDGKACTVYIYNVKDPLQPTEVTRYDPKDENVQVFATGGRLYLAHYANSPGLRIAEPVCQ